MSTAPHPHRGLPPVNWPRRLRIGLAVLMFGGLALALMDFRELAPVQLGHWLAAVQFVPSLVALAGGALASVFLFASLLLLTLLLGRVYCSVLCPLGVFQDIVSRLARLLPRKRKLMPFAKEQRLLRHAFVWGVVALVVAGWGAFGLSVVDPYSHFGRLASLLFRPALTWVNNHLVWLAEALGWHGLYRVDLPQPAAGAFVFPALVLTLVVLMSALRGRLYCNTLCPVGTVLGWAAKRAAFRIGIDKAACTKCANCIRACKAQCIDLKNGEVDFSRCVGCQDCVSVCDEHGIRYRWSWGRRAERPAAPSSEAPADAGRRSFLKGSGTGLAVGAGLGFLAGASRARAQEGYPSDGDKTAAPVTASPAMSAGVTPPGSRGVPRFLDRCTACQLCVSACPKHVLQPALFEYGLKGFMKPRLDFTASFCDYDCRACAEACPDGAIELMPIEERQLEQIGLARFYEERCIVKQKGTDCAACSEHCPTKAVETVPYGDNLRLPQVNESLCIGCGACEFACPVQPEKAILVTGLQTHGRAVRSVEQPAAAAKPPAGDFPF